MSASPLDGLPVGEAPAPATPGDNPPGLAAIAYRFASREELFARLLAGLPVATLPDGPFAGRRPLLALASRETDDPAIALLDAWADLGDVLAFYQERIANEGFLRTATEQRSVLELARLAAYDLSPGVAASAFLTFTVEDSPGSPTEVRIPAGTQVQSIPGQDELPQTFETAEEATAHVEWNALLPRLFEPQSFAGTSEIFLAGSLTGLAVGDTLLVVATAPAAAEGEPEAKPALALARVAGVTVDDSLTFTRVRLEAPLELSALMLADRTVQVFALRQNAPFFGHDAPRYGSLPIGSVVKKDPYSESDPNNDWDLGRTIWTDSKNQLLGDGTDAETPVALLGRKLDGLIDGGWVVISGEEVGGTGRRWEAYQLATHRDATVSDYALTGESSGLVLRTAADEALPAELGARTAFDVRRTTAYLASEELPLAEKPITAAYPEIETDGNLAALTLDRQVAGLRAGQALILSATPLAGGGSESRRLTLQRVDDSDPARTRLVFQQPLPAGRWVRATVVLAGNVVLATHGESVAEVLGSGDSAQRNQRFVLAQPPLTYLSAPLPGGRRSSLEVRVDGVLWQEVDTLFGAGPQSRVYRLEIDDQGQTSVTFGDGSDGARLPTGNENVTATYRSGIGLAGQVKANTLQLLTARPLGIREVTNPLPAAGAAPPDGVTAARANAPVALRTLGHVVTPRDFADFARTFAGIAKVEVLPIAGVLLTVAGVDGAAVDAGSALYTNLFKALEAARVPGPPITITSYEPVQFDVAAQLVVDPSLRAEDVFRRAEADLLAAFSFDRRELGQPVFASDVLAVIQATGGVVAVDLDAFQRSGGTLAGSSTVATQIPAQSGRFVGGQPLPAQLLTINPNGILLRARTP